MGLALALPAGGAGAAAAPGAVPPAGDQRSHGDIYPLVPGQTRQGLPPGVELDVSDGTLAGAAWSPADGLLYVVTLGSSSCPRIPEPEARNTKAGAGLVHDDAVGDIDVTLWEPGPGGVCTADWVPTTTVVAAPEGKDHGGPVSFRVEGVGKTSLAPRAEPGRPGSPAWIAVDD
ncbi:hypothetical protein GCM10028784_12860 [Myceligenerans cantabricum]